MIVVESLEGDVSVPRAFLQFAVLKHVDILQAVVVGVDVVFVRTLADVQHALILPVDVYDGGTPGLPVQVDVLCHRALDDGVAHVQVVKVVTGIAQHDALEVLQPGLLVGEKLVVQALRAKPLVGIDNQRLHFRVTRCTAGNAHLAQLVDDALLSALFKQLDIHRAAPVVFVVLLLRTVSTVYVDANLLVVQIAVVRHNRDDGQRQLARRGEEDVRMTGRARRHVTVAKQLRPHNPCRGDVDGLRIQYAAGGGLAAVDGIADGGTLGRPLGHA